MSKLSYFPHAADPWRLAVPPVRCKNKKAHLPAIQDYLLLIRPAISNKQARAFLHLASEDTAFRLLSVMPSSGTKKGRIYFLQ
ncbi:hypothetical protein BBV17_00100 [Cytobacillus oceanisediminis]|uniref:Uncharacterized protein n=1 Tax=Cytobacillus oceanisediminis TaxID=665099 RepID=A0ABX3D0N7_9BACI|nr:hypothetical protein BBV17_00100 [Cytobacillus oceanisediminis]